MCYPTTITLADLRTACRVRRLPACDPQTTGFPAATAHGVINGNRRRLSSLGRNAYRRAVFGLAPHVLFNCYQLERDAAYITGAGLDAPDHIPAGSMQICVPNDSEQFAFIRTTLR